MFADRNEAGEKLAERLKRYSGRDALVLAIPRGGVPVAAPIARALDLPLDLAMVRKVGLPGHEELAVAAIAGPGGSELVINEDVARRAGLDRAAIEILAVPEKAELARRRAVYGARELAVKGKTLILVDDGLATGATVRAAAQALRRLEPLRIVLAVPVAPGDVLDDLRGLVDDVECLSVPVPFVAVGAHFRQFPQTSDREVQDLLREAAG